jgi:hypothetical protein
MPRVGFEPTIPAFERAKTVHALDREDTVIGWCNLWKDLFRESRWMHLILTNLIKWEFKINYKQILSVFKTFATSSVTKRKPREWHTDVGFKVLPTMVMKSSVLWDITPCSVSKVNWRSGRTVAFTFIVEKQAGQESSIKQVASRACFVLVSCFLHSSTLKKKATYSFETSTEFQRTTRFHVPEGRTLQWYPV